jgi:uncharacterized protein YjdB
MVPYGLALAQGRENYDYVEITVYEPGVETGAANAVTSVSTVANTFTKNSHGLTAGQPVRFSAGVLPVGLVANTVGKSGCYSSTRRENPHAAGGYSAL